MGSSRSVKIGSLTIGGDSPVRIESMLKTPLSDLQGCFAELEALAGCGCELVRVALPEAALAENLKKLAAYPAIPLMADIHFDYRLAIAALDAGCPSIRVNPGNMGGRGLGAVVRLAKEREAVIRVGANGGSLGSHQLETAKGDRCAALVLAVGEQVRLLADNDFENVIISAKSSDVMETVRANALLSEKHAYPIHIGITEAGPGLSGVVKGAAGISLLLAQGIGDTVRVSLTAPGTEEVRTGYRILRSLGIRGKGIDLISCPTCGRKRVDVLSLIQLVETLLPKDLPDDFSIAVMGCEVNGPKEAAGADLGIAGTQTGFVLFSKGKPFAVGETEKLPELLKAALDEAFHGKKLNL